MPILDVQIVLKPDERPDDSLAGEIANAAGTVLESPDGNAWVKLSFIPRTQYAENGSDLPDDLAPVFVSLLSAKLREGAARSTLALDLSAAIARAIGRPQEQVHVLFEPPAAGRIAFGGVLRDS